MDTGKKENGNRNQLQRESLMGEAGRNRKIERFAPSNILCILTINAC